MAYHIWISKVIHTHHQERVFGCSGANPSHCWLCHGPDQRAGASLLGRKVESGLFSSENRRLMGDQYLKRAYKQERNQIFTWSGTDRTGGKGFKLKNGKIRLDVRQKITQKVVVRRWQRLPIEAVHSPPLEASGSGWLEPWAACQAGGKPAHSRGFGKLSVL